MKASTTLLGGLLIAGASLALAGAMRKRATQSDPEWQRKDLETRCDEMSRELQRRIREREELAIAA